MIYLKGELKSGNNQPPTPANAFLAFCPGSSGSSDARQFPVSGVHTMPARAGASTRSCTGFRRLRIANRSRVLARGAILGAAERSRVRHCKDDRRPAALCASKGELTARLRRAFTHADQTEVTVRHEVRINAESLSIVRDRHAKAGSLVGECDRDVSTV
jgi:hypothetical protein